jgi:hypothetical protein
MKAPKVGTKAIKAAKKPSKAVVTKFATAWSLVIW